MFVTMTLNCVIDSSQIHL